MLMEGVSRLLLLFSVLSLDSSDQQKYAVIFDGGSTGTRVHVFSFDNNMDLLPIGDDFEFYLSTTPGLSSFENDTTSIAEYLRPLLHQAEAVVPNESRPKTPVRLGATAGLRLLPGNVSEAILNAVRDVFANESSLDYRPEWVSVLDGTDEGAYEWMTVNYLLGNLGEKYSETVALSDLGWASVQMAYAISEESAANAPTGNDDHYVSDKDVLGTKYHLYTHSYLNYGEQAARAQSMKLSGAYGNPCVTNGYQVYKVSPPRSGTSLRRCAALTRKILRVDAPCSYKDCSFDGVWSGGGGDGQKNLYIASSFYYRATDSGIVNENTNQAIIRPIAYWSAAKRACRASVDNIKFIFPLITDREVPFLCMDLVYEYTLLVDGFGIDPFKEITVVKDVEYKGSLMDAAWPLGCAIELLSNPSQSSI